MKAIQRLLFGNYVTLKQTIGVVVSCLFKFTGRGPFVRLGPGSISEICVTGLDPRRTDDLLQWSGCSRSRSKQKHAERLRPIAAPLRLYFREVHANSADKSFRRRCERNVNRGAVTYTCLCSFQNITI